MLSIIHEDGTKQDISYSNFLHGMFGGYMQHDIMSTDRKHKIVRINTYFNNAVATINQIIEIKHNGIIISKDDVKNKYYFEVIQLYLDDFYKQLIDEKDEIEAILQIYYYKF